MNCHHQDLITDQGICVDNVKRFAQTHAESLQHWIGTHLVLSFVVALVLIGACNFLAKRPSSGNGSSVDYQLQQINNHLARLRK